MAKQSSRGLPEFFTVTIATSGCNQPAPWPLPARAGECSRYSAPSQWAEAVEPEPLLSPIRATGNIVPFAWYTMPDATSSIATHLLCFATKRSKQEVPPSCVCGYHSCQSFFARYSRWLLAVGARSARRHLSHSRRNWRLHWRAVAM